MIILEYLEWVRAELGPTFGKMWIRKIGLSLALSIKIDNRCYTLRESWEPTDILRTSGDVICEECGDTYYHHPSDMKLLDSEDRPFLRVACDGRRLKL